MLRLWLAFVPLLFTACGESVARLQRDLSRLESSVNDMRSFQAEQTSQLSDLRTEVRNINGRIDTIEHSHSNRVGSDLTSLRDDLSSLKRRVPPPPIVPAATLEVDELLATQLPAEIGKLLTDGLDEIRQGNFNNAVPMLQSALDSSYGRDWSANILFWLGVSYDGLSDNRKALASYNEVVSRFSRHERAPLALLRQSSVFVRLGDKQTAKLTLKKLLADYPKSSEIAQAKERLKTL